jgi:hypothetical protein
MRLGRACARVEHLNLAFYRHPRITCPSHTLLPPCSIPPRAALLTGWPRIGRLTESVNPFEDRSEELSWHGNFRVNQEERELVEMICDLRQGIAIEQTDLWLIRQTKYHCKRRLDNYKAVEWAIAAKEPFHDIAVPEADRWEADGEGVALDFRRTVREPN